MKTSFRHCGGWLVAALLLLSVQDYAAAGSQRTFVSTTGVDNPSCSAANPCRQFAAAMAATNPNGEIIVLSSGGYGAVTITQAVSIIAPSGVYAGISVGGGGDGIIINAGQFDVVRLKNLTINSVGGMRGIHLMSAFHVIVEDSVISNFFSGGNGVDILVDDAPPPIQNRLTLTRSLLRTSEQGVVVMADTNFHEVDIDHASILSMSFHCVVGQGKLQIMITDSQLNDCGNVAGVQLTTTASNQGANATLQRVTLKGAAVGVLGQTNAGPSGVNINVSDTTIDTTQTPMKAIEAGGGQVHLSLARGTLLHFNMRAIDAQATNNTPGAGVDVMVTDSLITDGGGDRAVSADASAGGFVNAQISNTRMQNLGSACVYAHGGTGFVWVTLFANTLQASASGVTADTNSQVILQSNVITQMFNGAGLAIIGGGAGMQSLNNNLVFGNHLADATPSLVPPK
jgi:hypothetical protein